MVVFRGSFEREEDEEECLLDESNSSNGQNRVRMKKWMLAILGLLIVSVLFVNGFVVGQFQIAHLINATVLQNNIADETVRLMKQKISGYLVNNEGCRIAALDPFDPISRRYMSTEKPIKCEGDDQIPLIESNNTAIYINPAALYQFNNKSESISCCWMSFNRKPGHDNDVIYNGTCHSFDTSTSIDEEFVKVECYAGQHSVYRDYHAFVVRKNEIEKRCRKREEKWKSERRLSLLIIGLDSVSRLNFHRMMPRTVKSLTELGSIELLGYNKVGDNTYPNLVPVLMGLSPDELHPKYLKVEKGPFDDCPLIWKNFSEFGYRTIFAEDACSMTTFNYVKSGFRNSPTDYYLRPFCVAAEKDIGNNFKMNANLCLGNRKNFENLLTYTRKVAEAFARDRYFAFFWQSSLTHDFFNYPQLGDKAYSDFIGHLKKNNLLNNTALIVMSDHGMRFGSYRQTYQGRMEASLPFVFFVFPGWWKEKYSGPLANLRRNAFSLTTHYDLHETLLDILTMETTSEEPRRPRETNAGNLTRGMSLFSPIPSHRTCSMAGIPEHWCMCHTSNNVSLNDTRVRNTTEFLVSELNRLVKKYPQCSTLKLKKLTDAKMWIDRQTGDAEKMPKKIAPWVDFTITIETEPGNAIFEASIRHNETSNRLVGSISRLNTYGSQSLCVDDSNMRLYCYCR